MTQLKMTKQMLLAAGCALVTALVVAPAALAQGPAADEYTLGKLPQAGGDTAAGQGSGPASIAASSDAGGVPVLLIVLVAAAAVCTAAAIWRMRGGASS